MKKTKQLRGRERRKKLNKCLVPASDCELVIGSLIHIHSSRRVESFKSLCLLHLHLETSLTALAGSSPETRLGPQQVHSAYAQRLKNAAEICRMVLSLFSTLNLQGM